MAAVLTVGNELLYGQTVDTNAAWLGRSLAACGIPVVRSFTVGDASDEIRAGLEGAMGVADLVLVSGGLGPTPDDLTKESVAAFLGRELQIDRALLAGLEERFRRSGLGELPAPNVSQAEVPVGAIVLENAHGTAPGLVLEADSTVIVLLPGVPHELRGIFDGDLQRVLGERFGDRLQPVHHRVIHTTGVPESRLSELVTDRLPDDMGPVSLAFLPDLRGVDLRLTARGVSASEATDWLGRVERALEPVVRKWRFEAKSGDLVEALTGALLRAGKKVAVAESCTGGLVAQRITERAGSSEVFVGGVVAYDDAVKVAQLGVSRDDLERHGAVSEPVARQLATGVAERLGASAGIGVTGVAGPGGGTPDKPVGTVFLSVALGETVETRLVRFVGDRQAIRERAAQAALAQLFRLLARLEAGPER